MIAPPEGKPRHALVTGATGQVGSHVVERLLAEGWQLRALVRDPSRAGALATQGVMLESGDVLDPVSFARAARGCEVIVHAAAVITPRGGWEAFRRVNLDGTGAAIAAAERSGATLVHVSSVAVYGGSARYEPGGRTTESTPFQPLPPSAFYARSKRDSEAMVMEAHAAGRIRATALRPSVVYGRRDRQFVPRIGRLLSRGIAPLIGGGQSTLAIVHAANVADGIVRAATHPAAAGEAFNLAHDHDVTVERFFRLAAAGMGQRLRLVRVPLWVAQGSLAIVRTALKGSGGRFSVISNSAQLEFITRDNPFDSAKARAVLGWNPAVVPEMGVPDAFQWWRRHR